LIYAAKRPSVEFVVPPTEYRVLLPQVDGYVKLTEEEARELYEALGRLLPTSYYPDPTSTSARSQ